MAIRSFPISLAFSPNSRGRDPQSLSGIEPDDADENEPAGTNAPEGMVQQFKPRCDAREGVDKEEC